MKKEDLLVEGTDRGVSKSVLLVYHGEVSRGTHPTSVILTSTAESNSIYIFGNPVVASRSVITIVLAIDTINNTIRIRLEVFGST